MILPLADAGVAAATMRSDLDKYWAGRERDQAGWERLSVDDLHTIIKIPARTSAGEVHPYFIKLGAEYYDLFPPTVLFVAPTEGWPRARSGSPWWPKFSQCPGWFQLHDNYRLEKEGTVIFDDQLVCFSMSANYYLDHSPTPAQRWQQGRHTVAATLTRLEEVLSPPCYVGPDASRSA